MDEHKQKPPLVVIGAKVPTEIRDAIKQKANAEDRSVSQVISRLLASHPSLKTKRQKAVATVA
jgi:hypothetical protein